MQATTVGLFAGRVAPLAAKRTSTLKVSRPGYNVTATLSPAGIRHERMYRKNMQMLELALKDVEAYCEMLPEGKKSEQAHEVLYYLMEKRDTLSEGCILEGGEGTLCDRLVHLGQMIQEFGLSGGVAEMVHSLTCVVHAEHGTMTEHEEQVCVLPVYNFPNATPETNLRAMFDEFDRNSDGKLSMDELRDAMEELGDRMSPAALTLVFEAMGVHGFVTFEEFKDIIEAEEIRSKSKDSETLRSIARGMSIGMSFEHTPDYGS